MTTAKQQRKAQDGNRSYRVSLAALFVSVCGLLWQVYQAHVQKHSYEKQFGSIETSIRLLTATVAPQLQKAIDDSLASALTAVPSIVPQKFTTIEDDTSHLRSIRARLPNDAVEHSSAALEKAVELHPDVVPAWRAAAQMVSYRSELRGEPNATPNCFVAQSGGGWHVGDPVMRYHDCTLDLDDISRFNAVAPRIEQPTTGAKGQVIPTVFLQNGTVLYSGGKMISIARLDCENCFFSLGSPTTIPPASGRAMSQQLLIADLGKVEISLPSS